MVQNFVSESDSQKYHNRAYYKYNSNKDIPIAQIDKIEIEKFRSLSNREVKLGRYLTIISGKNGTMKTTIMGLIAHPFSNNTNDAFGIPLKTKLGEVFKLSKKYDDAYSYNIYFTSIKHEKIKEKVNIDVVGNRHRIVVSGHGKGDGNFVFNTSFHNLGRLNPIVETSAEEKNNIILTKEEQTELVKFYSYVFVSSSPEKFSAVSDDKKKKTFGPTGTNAKYDFNSISSGEDNLGSIFNKLVAFERAGNGGVLCIDEIEASLHPSAQVNIINYLYKWAKMHNVQIVLTTHSLHIIQNLYLNRLTDLANGDIIIDFISYSKAGSDKNYAIISNPKYSLAYQELTLSKPEDITEKHKVTVFCEDKVAKHMLKSLLGRKICNLITIESNLDDDENNCGTSKHHLINLCKNFPTVIKQSNSFIVFDGDVKDNEVEELDDSLFIRLPDPDKYAIEKRILIYLLSLEPNHPIFNKIGKLQDNIRQELIQECRINPPEIQVIRGIEPKSCKKWAKLDKNIFKQCITQYCKDLPTDIKTKFKEEFIDHLNIANDRLGLPNVDIT